MKIFLENGIIELKGEKSNAKRSKYRITSYNVCYTKLLRLNPQTLAELKDYFTTVQTDSTVKVVILTGTGEKAFVAGGDLSVMAPMDPLAARAGAELAQNVLQLIEQGSKPVIATVNGYA